MSVFEGRFWDVMRFFPKFETHLYGVMDSFWKSPMVCMNYGKLGMTAFCFHLFLNLLFVMMDLRWNNIVIVVIFDRFEVE